MDSKKLNYILILYRLHFRDGSERAYKIELDKKTFALQEPENSTYPDWCKLENAKCEHCPLSSEEHEYCPVARNLSDIVNFFKDRVSYEEVEITVATRERTYSKKTSLQVGLFSMFGLIMSTSACPHMDFLKPMARFHLPFSSTEETLFRVTSMHLLSQYFKEDKKGRGDFSFKQLEILYKNISQINRGMLNRISGLSSGDATVNSISILESFGQMLQMDIMFDLSKVSEIFEGNSDTPVTINPRNTSG
jgi:hypothetical protein